MIAVTYMGGPLDGGTDEVPDDCLTVAVEGEDPSWHYVLIDDCLCWIPAATFQRKATCNWRNK